MNPRIAVVAGLVAALLLAPAGHAALSKRTGASAETNSAYVLPSRHGLSDFGLSDATSTEQTKPGYVLPSRHGLSDFGLSSSSVSERAVAADERNLRTSLPRYYEAAEAPTAAASQPDLAPSPASSRLIEWPQLGIGFGIGVVLMLGVWLGSRATRTRVLTH